MPGVTSLTADEFSALPEVAGCKSELIEGETVMAPMPLSPHTRVIKNVERILERQFPNFEVVREAGWLIRTNEADSVLGPDLMVLDPGEYLSAVKGGRYFEGRPQFVVEVVSPSERKARRLGKIGLYLDAGAGAVVEIHYLKRMAVLYRNDEALPEVLKDTIDWPFRASLPDLFVGL